MKLDSQTQTTRRVFLKAASAGAATSVVAFSFPQTARAARRTGWPELAGEVGMTTSSLSGHLVAKPARPTQFTMLELPRILRDELGMKVIDLNTSSLGSDEPVWLDKVREAVRDAGCTLINLKMNQRGLDMNSPDRDKRARALSVYKRSIDAASRLGIPFARPLPLQERPDMTIHVASYRELADYAAERDVTMAVENYAWMESDPHSVPNLIEAIARDVVSTPDTGNWASDEIRYAGLKAAFASAVSCDFKARTLGPNGEHSQYDLERCFDVGWQSGFHGPWCLEHADADRTKLFTELALLRDMLKRWMAERKSV